MLPEGQRKWCKDLCYFAGELTVTKSVKKIDVIDEEVEGFVSPKIVRKNAYLKSLENSIKTTTERNKEEITYRCYVRTMNFIFFLNAKSKNFRIPNISCTSRPYLPYSSHIIWVETNDDKNTTSFALLK